MPATFSHTMDPKSTLRNSLMPGILTMARLLLLSISLVIGSPGCGQPKTDETNTAQAPSPLNGTWIVKDMYTPGKTFEDLFPARPVVTLDLDQGLVSGMSGCNQFMGKVSVSGQTISLPSDLAVTKRACVKGMEGEALFLDLLRKANHWTMYNDGQLHLLINDMTVIWLERTR